MSWLAAVALACSCLVAVGRAWPDAGLVAAGVLGLLGAVTRRRLAALACTLALARGACDAERHQPSSPGMGFTLERTVRLRALVLDAPQATRRGTRVSARILASDPRLPRDLCVSLWLDSSAGVPRRGSWIEARALVRAPRYPPTPGGFDERGWLANRGASLMGWVEGAAWSEVRGPPPSMAAYLDLARRRWSERLGTRVPGEAGEFLRGLLLGERSRVRPETVDDLRRAGALHLLALSGQHVLLVAALLRGLAAWLRLGGRSGAGFALAGVWGYALLTGASPSVIRAAASVTWSAWGRALGRRLSGADGLAWGTALPIFVRPSLAADVGFQLSCLASAGLWAAARMRRALRPEEGPRRVPRALDAVVFPIAATACAQAAVLPLLAARFGAVSVVGFASNLVLVPACDAVLALGLPLLALDGLAPVPGSLWRVVAALAAFILRAGESFASWPLAWVPCTLSTVAAIAMVVAAALPWIEGLRGARIAAAGLWLGFAVCAFAPLASRRDVEVRYWMLDVGQGDAQVLEFADGATWVVDVGDAREGFDAGRSVVAPFLRARGVRAIDLAVITHEDRDHCGGLAAVARDVPIRRLVSGAECLAVLRASAPTRPIAAGETLRAGVRVLWPPPGGTGLASNERSVVLEIEAGGERIVLTGDADSMSEAGWLARAHAPLAALKLGHHGSRRSTAVQTLNALHPRLALVSCGARNRFGHPHPETIERLEERHIAWWRTDRQGTLALDLGAHDPPPAPIRALSRGPLD